MEYKIYTCKRLRLLNFLVNEKGFKPFATIPDYKNPSYNVFKFYMVPGFGEALDEYFAQYKK